MEEPYVPPHAPTRLQKQWWEQQQYTEVWRRIQNSYYSCWINYHSTSNPLSPPLYLSHIYIYIWSHIQTDNSVIKFKPHFGFQGFFFFLFSFPEPPRIGERFSRRKQGSWDVAVVLCGGLLVGASDSLYPTSEEPQPLCRDHGRYSEGDQYAYWQALSPCAAGLFQDPGLHAL